MLIVSDCMLVPVHGGIDAASAPALRRHIEHLVKSGCRRVILDLDRADFIDSAGMAAILASARLMRHRGGVLSMVNASDPVMRMLTLGCLVPFIPCTAKRDPRDPVPPLPPGSSPQRRLTIRVTKDNLEAARSRLRELFADLPLSEEESFDMTLAAGEAMGNCVLHTPKGAGSLTAEVFPDRLVIEAVDNGPGFEIGDDEEPVVTLEHGRGIKLMRLLTDGVEIGNKPYGHGTVVRMVKLFGRRRSPLEEGILEVMSA